MVERLRTEVWSLHKCSGCGSCVAACSKQVLEWQVASHPALQKRTKTLGLTRVELDTCSFCEKLCEEVCPRLQDWAEQPAIVTLAARARGPIQAGSPNDVIRSILVAGRSAGLIDGVVMLDLDPWTLKPVARVVTTVEEIVESVGPQYLWAPLLDALNEAIFTRGMQNLAVVGTPCTAEAVRRLRETDNPRLKFYRESIRLNVSVFCASVFHPEMIDEVILKELDLTRDKIKRLEFSPDRDWLNVILWDGSVFTVSRQKAEMYSRRGCGVCEDFLGESADLAIGSVGAPAGASTLIIRSRTGEMFVRNAIQLSLLDTSQNVDQDAIMAAAKQKQARERAEVFKDLRILMLDALADPMQHSEAVKQFVRLYRTPMPSGLPENSRRGCSGC
jgi:coenzyme F420 hydrogenase subunit beta